MGTSIQHFLTWRRWSKTSPEVIYLNVAKAGGLQRQGVKGEAVVDYREPLTTPDLKFSGFPEG